MIEPQSSQVNVPPTQKKRGIFSKIGAGLGGLAGAVGGFFTGGPPGAAAGAVKGASAGYQLGGMADKPGIRETPAVGGERTPLVRALRQDPQAQIAALNMGQKSLMQSPSLPENEIRTQYEMMEEAKRRLQQRMV